MAWMADVSDFESLYGQEFYLLQVVQTDSGAHPASYPGLKRPRREANKCRGQENVDPCIHSPIRLHEVVLN
jgi:hypothetical protein